MKFPDRATRFTGLAFVLATGMTRPVEGAAAESRPAPAWQLKNVDGRSVTSDQFKGKLVVLDFWATWCAPCRAEIPGYNELQKKYGKEGLVVVGVSLDQEGPAVVKKFMAGQRMNYPVVMGDEKIVKAFGGVEGIPTTFLIDRNGVIRHRKLGAMPTADYEAILKPLLKEAARKKEGAGDNP